MAEFSVYTDRGRMKIEAECQAHAEEVARSDGHRVVKHPLYTFWVWLGDNEWGNDKMREVAKEVFARYPGHTPMIVEVSEHGGWHLHFNRDGEIVRSASTGLCNDAFWKSVEGHELEVIGSERRGETPATTE